jgi:multiple sugar transport system substrate-binding protein
MNRHKASWIVSLRVAFSLAMIAAFVLSACAQPAAPTAAPTQAPQTQPTQPPAPTSVPPTKAPEVAPTSAPTAAPTTAPQAATEDANYSPDIPDPTSPVTIKFATWTHTEGDIWSQLAERFTKIHPNITIEFQDIPAEEAHDKLLTQISAGNPPDAAYVDSGTASDFGQREALVPLDDYIAKSQVIALNDYVPAFLTAAKANDKVYGLPIDGETTVLFYRTDRFQEAGLDPAKPPTTWEEFKTDAEKLTDAAKKKYGYIVFATDWESSYYFWPWLWQAGGDQLDPKDPNHVIWDSPEGQKAADFYINLKNYSPVDYLNSNSWDGRVAFAQGDVAMYMAGTWFAGEMINSYKDETTGKWATAALPCDKRCATTLASDDLVVFSASKNPEAAYKWIEFVSAPQNMLVLNLGTPENPGTLLPPRQSLLNDPKITEGRPYMQGFIDSMKSAYVSDVVQPRFGEIEPILFGYLNKAFYGEMDGATAVKKAAEEANALLKQ